MNLYQGNCLEIMPTFSDHSIDLIASDLPYGISGNKWDSPIDLVELWSNFKRVLKPGGVVVLTATQPFTSQLIVSNLKGFKVEYIWKKTVGSGQLNISHQPLRMHESCLVFYDKRPTYNPQYTSGEPYSIHRVGNYKEEGYGIQREHGTVNQGFRHPQTVLTIPNPRIKGGHPTQKPVKLMEFFILTYSNEGDTVLDCCMGSGSTGEAAINTNRDFIGIELDDRWFNVANERLQSLPS